MFMPYASEYVTEIATNAIDDSCFSSDVSDQFLTMLAMDDNNYDGDGDFGTLTRIDLDDELRVVLVLIDAITEDTADQYIGTLVTGWSKPDVVLGWGGDQKWWADWYTYTTAEAEAEQARFSERYSLFLGCEDCGHGYEDDPCICNDEPETPEHPFLTEVKDAERMGEAFGPAE